MGSSPIFIQGHRRGRSSGIAHSTQIPDSYKQIEPFGELVILKTEISEEATQGGIILTADAVDKVMSGEVSAIGNGIMPTGGTRPFTVKPGDFVIYAQQLGKDIRWNGEDYKIVKESEILGTTSKRATLNDDIEELQPINDFIMVSVLQAQTSANGMFMP